MRGGAILQLPYIYSSAASHNPKRCTRAARLLRHELLVEALLKLPTSEPTIAAICIYTACLVRVPQRNRPHLQPSHGNPKPPAFPPCQLTTNQSAGLTTTTRPNSMSSPATTPSSSSAKTHTAMAAARLEKLPKRHYHLCYDGS